MALSWSRTESGRVTPWAWFIDAHLAKLPLAERQDQQVQIVGSPVCQRFLTLARLASLPKAGTTETEEDLRASWLS